MMRRIRNAFPIHLFALSALLALPIAGAAQAGMSAPPGVLNVAQAARQVPHIVFFAGQLAPTQARNSAGVRFAGGPLMLAALVDSSGYSTGMQQKYQAYLLTEVPLRIGGHTLPVGAYGMGVVNGQFEVMDIAGHQVLQAAATHDTRMHRPVPLRVLSAGSGSYRLCFGRDCVEFRQAM